MSYDKLVRKVMSIQFTKIERVRFDEDRQKEAAFWAQRSIAERVLAAWDLADDDLFAGERHEPEAGAAFSLRRVSQSWR
jgi:hypothetical protein